MTKKQRLKQVRKAIAGKIKRKRTLHEIAVAWDVSLSEAYSQLERLAEGAGVSPSDIARPWLNAGGARDDLVRALIKSGGTQAEIIEKYDVSPDDVSRILAGQTPAEWESMHNTDDDGDWPRFPGGCARQLMRQAVNGPDPDEDEDDPVELKADVPTMGTEQLIATWEEMEESLLRARDDRTLSRHPDAVKGYDKATALAGTVHTEIRRRLRLNDGLADFVGEVAERVGFTVRR